MNKKMEESELRKMISSILYLSGIAPNMKGFIYLKEAIVMVYNDYDTFNTITKIVYPEITKLHKVSSKAVERCIRIAIEKAWKNGWSNEFYNKIGFRWLNKRPTNSEYIFMIVELLNNL